VTPRRRFAAALPLLVALLATALPRVAHAGGGEFPGDGVRGLGRGGARAARADDPSIMTRNPAALALMWDDQVTLGAHLLLVDACMQPTGAFGIGIKGDAAIDLGDGPVRLLANPGDQYLDGRPVVGFADEPYPQVCYQGPAPFLPTLAVSEKLSDDLGVGLGFFPPDSAGLFQWGNRDGTIDTPSGRRPNPLRYYRSQQNVSYFSVLAAAGYRLAPWISVGAGLQWMLVVYEATTWATPVSALDPQSDVRGDLFGRDLFVPGLIGSVQLQPWDFLDVVIGFKWSDRVHSKVKLDITTGAFGTGEVFEYRDGTTGQITSLGSSIPTTAPNQPGVVDSPPVWAPQLTLALRYKDLLKPPFHDLRAAHKAAGKTVEDSMETERWDAELDFIYYFTSVYDRSQYTTRDAQLSIRTINEMGTIGDIPASAGDCTKRDASGTNCIGDRVVKTDLGGKNQFTARAGAEYNLFPGLLALRAGASYEARGQSPEMLNVLSYMLSRTGLHAGVTLRVANKTDISIGYAHFFQEDVRLQVNNSIPASRYEPRYRMDKFHFKPGAGVGDVNDEGGNAGGFDGTAKVEVPNADVAYPVGPYFINAGSYYYNLDVLSLGFTQHF
jgi:long-subunit fatty acid transport protein